MFLQSPSPVRLPRPENSPKGGGALYSTQWDSLAHVRSHFDADGDGSDEAVFYNGFRAGEDIRAGVETQAPEAWARYENPEAGALSIAVLAEHGAQGRGVMIDIERHIGRKRQAVGYDQLMRIPGGSVPASEVIALRQAARNRSLTIEGSPRRTNSDAMQYAAMYVVRMAEHYSELSGLPRCRPRLSVSIGKICHVQSEASCLSLPPAKPFLAGLGNPLGR
ncbi:hypothetical protein LMG23994_06971 [Cupriavidus pinatubonensis]|uniref:Uncharacterized protein n=1 Tax=Cupriavidus pinatubonensis TaxID=248026 RepID=A0ABM8Y432_9BURK|nr:hypothetical protein LMG23994_06971 [Cupriavidus pinatubonensis]